jgi:hypothetical protein
VDSVVGEVRGEVPVGREEEEVDLKGRHVEAMSGAVEGEVL